MGLAYTPDEIQELLTARIETLTPTDGYTSESVKGYGHGASDAWREADEPLVPEHEPSSQIHLAFWVDDRELLDTQRTRSMVEDVHEWPVVEAPVVVRFLFEMRPAGDSRKRDWRGAARAAVAVYRHLLAEGWQTGFVVKTDPRPITRAPLRTGQGDWLVVEVRVRVLFDLSLAEPTAA